MDYKQQQPPTPLGTRLPAAILTRIYYLVITYPPAIPLDSIRREPFYPPLLQTSSHIRSRFLPAFFETNTFTLRRASLCKRAENKRNPALIPMHHRVHIRNFLLSTYTGDSECLNRTLGPSHCHGLQVRRASCQDIITRPKQKQQHSCPFCNLSTSPPPQCDGQRCCESGLVAYLECFLQGCCAEKSACLGGLHGYRGSGVGERGEEVGDEG